MEVRKDEGLPLGAQKAIPLCETEFKSKENCICLINGSSLGTGFFCKIEFKGNLTPVLITNYHVVDDFLLNKMMNKKKKLTFYIKNVLHSIEIHHDSQIYSSSSNKYDTQIIKLEEGEVDNYLEIDENIFRYGSHKNYENEGIYILHYPNAGEAKLSKGKGFEEVKLSEYLIKHYDMKHLCHTEPGSSGGPILSIKTNKVIGIHKGSIIKLGKCNYNIGTF